MVTLEPGGGGSPLLAPDAFRHSATSTMAPQPRNAAASASSVVAGARLLATTVCAVTRTLAGTPGGASAKAGAGAGAGEGGRSCGGGGSVGWGGQPTGQGCPLFNVERHRSNRTGHGRRLGAGRSYQQGGKKTEPQVSHRGKQMQDVLHPCRFANALSCELCPHVTELQIKYNTNICLFSSLIRNPQLQCAIH